MLQYKADIKSFPLGVYTVVDVRFTYLDLIPSVIMFISIAGFVVNV